MKRIFSVTLMATLLCALLSVGASAAGNSKTFTMECGDSFTISNYVAEATEEINIGNPMFGASMQSINYYIVNQDTTITFHVKQSDVDGTISSYFMSEDTYYLSGDSSSYYDLGNGDTARYGWDVTLKASDFVSKELPIVNIHLYIFGSEPLPGTWDDGETMYISKVLDSVSAYIKYDDGTRPAAPAAPKGIEATPTASKVLVDGKETTFEAYTISENNYFKIRDIASVLSGTGKQFEVVWDGAKNAIAMTSGQPYTAVGGELAPGDGTDKAATANTAKIYLDGEAVSLTAYTIGGNNFVKLRDLGQLFDFGVRWDGSVVIDTTTGYVAP